MSKIRKNRIWAEKKNRKIEKEILFSGLPRNRLKLSKSPKNRFLDQYWSIYIHFSAFRHFRFASFGLWLNLKCILLMARKIGTTCTRQNCSLDIHRSSQTGKSSIGEMRTPEQGACSFRGYCRAPTEPLRTLKKIKNDQNASEHSKLP